MPMIVRLVNDDSEECRKILGVLVVLLLSRINPTARLKLYSLLLAWFGNDTGKTCAFLCLYADLNVFFVYWFG